MRKGLKEASIEDLDFNKVSGLLPVIAQDIRSGEVLMLAYSNREAVEETLRSGYATYWSRSRRKIWRKGESSGNRQKVIKVLVDCDSDALIYLVELEGPACHTGEKSCFFRVLSAPSRLKCQTEGRRGSPAP